MQLEARGHDHRGRRTGELGESLFDLRKRPVRGVVVELDVGHHGHIGLETQK